MAFKSKIKITDLPTLPHKDYMNIFRKDVERAAKFGQTGVVVLSDFQFACGEVGTLILLGKMSGPLKNYYKELKKERKQEKDFAKGTCYFEDVDGDNPKMRIALDDGKGKPTKMKKNGKKTLEKTRTCCRNLQR
jgi:hypothetical protein